MTGAPTLPDPGAAPRLQAGAAREAGAHDGAAAMSAAALVRTGEALPARPWPRWRLDPAGWAALAGALPGDALALLALWADRSEVHALFLEDEPPSGQGPAPLLASVPVVGGRYPALSPARPAAAWLERMVQDLWGHVAEGGAGPGAWLDHGGWPQRAPMAARPGPPQGAPEPPEFDPPAQDRQYQIGLGPLGGGTGPAHLRLTVYGERAVRLQARLGYAHRGVLSLLAGRTPREAAALVARVEAEATVAHGSAFAGAVEAALGVTPPPRALALRAALGELERIAIHLHVLGRAAAEAAVGGAAASPWAPLREAPLREAVLRACAAGFGHRLLMGVVVPGGLSADLAPGGAAALLAAAASVAAALPALLAGHDAAGGLAARSLGRGVATPAMVATFAAGGVAGRAAGRGFDARCLGDWHLDAARGHPSLPSGPVLRAGDADARLRLRLAELPGSLQLVQHTLNSLPDGPVAAALPPGNGEGLGVAEGPHGDAWCWVRMEGGVVAAAFLADPAWRCWPLMLQAAEGTPLAELPLVLGSFAATVAGMDL